MNKCEIFPHIDNTLLKPTATWDQIEALCRETVDCGMASACIPPTFVKRAHERFGDALTVCTVIGFPLGYNTAAVKVFEAQQALAQGAKEVDMVVNLGDVKAGGYAAITDEIASIKKAVGDTTLKVIVETCALTGDEKIALCRCVTEGGADFIKTSTGFGSAGAQLEDIALFRKHIGPHVKIKAAGGIRTREAMEKFLAAGCERIGSSAAATALAD